MADAPQDLKPHVITPEQGEQLKVFGLDMTVMLSTEHTGGAFSALVCSHGPGEGPPPHFHTSQEEYFFVLEGTYELTVDGKTTVAGPGTMVFLPRTVVHAFKNVGDTVARMIDWSIPGGQDRYFRTIHEQLGAGGFAASNLAELSDKYDTFYPAGH